MLETTKEERAQQAQTCAEVLERKEINAAQLSVLGIEFTARLCRDVDTLVGALGELVERLDLIGDDEQFKAAWILHAVHGGKYTGPTYQAELAKARELLRIGATPAA